MTKKQWLEALAALDVSQTQFADHLGRELRTVQRWIAGKTSTPPEVETLIRLLRKGKITFEDMP